MARCQQRARQQARVSGLFCCRSKFCEFVLDAPHIGGCASRREYSTDLIQNVTGVLRAAGVNISRWLPAVGWERE
jgi:hypothetical protein